MTNDERMPQASMTQWGGRWVGQLGLVDPGCLHTDVSTRPMGEDFQIFKFENYQIGVWVGPPFCVRMGLLVGKKLESRDLVSYNSDDGLRVVRACVGESRQIQVNPS
jgi:hypothetical protein